MDEERNGRVLHTRVRKHSGNAAALAEQAVRSDLVAWAAATPDDAIQRCA